MFRLFRRVVLLVFFMARAAANAQSSRGSKHACPMDRTTITEVSR